MVTTSLLTILGIVIVARSAARAAPPLSYLVGLAFLAYGLYRARFILRALRRGSGGR